jgi:hypothetical protein
MKTIELILNSIYILLGLIMAAVAVRHPRTVFVEVPTTIIKFVVHAIKRALFIDFLIEVVRILTGGDPVGDYKTKKKEYIPFGRATKFIITTGTDEGMIKTKVGEGIEALDNTLKIESFQFIPNSDQTITIPPRTISFHDFHYLVQLLTEGRMNSVGLVESKGLSYSVYNDPGTTNLIGETNHGEKFFISLMDDFSKKRFLRVSDEIETLKEYSLVEIRNVIAAISEQIK